MNSRSSLVHSLVRNVETRLREGGVAGARAEAEWLVGEAVGAGRTELYLLETPLETALLERIDQWIARRLGGEPLQHIVGYADCCGHRLEVSPDVLIPRPETETLIEQAVGFLQRRSAEHPAPTALDVGTGSGNIAISLALAVPSCVVVAVELSWNALGVARANRRRFRLEHRMHLIQADGVSATLGPFDLIIANPPYVPRAEVERLPEEVRCEPHLSLDGGEDGMHHHRRLAAEAPGLLRRGGALCMECSESQAEPLRELVARQAWVDEARIIHDLGGRPRGLWAAAR